LSSIARSWVRIRSSSAQSRRRLCSVRSYLNQEYTKDVHAWPQALAASADSQKSTQDTNRPTGREHQSRFRHLDRTAPGGGRCRTTSDPAHRLPKMRGPISSREVGPAPVPVTTQPIDLQCSHPLGGQPVRQCTSIDSTVHFRLIIPLLAMPDPDGLHPLRCPSRGAAAAAVVTVLRCSTLIPMSHTLPQVHPARQRHPS
jgi:hypothetical protein